MTTLAGKVALVTGAGLGIGAEVARTLSRAGAAVVVNYSKSKTEANAVAADITAKGGKAVAVQADVSKVSDIRRLFDETEKHFGAIDILVNNAAIAGQVPLDKATEEHFDRIFAVNVKGVFFCGQEAARRMKPGGCIVNFSSTTAVYPMANNSIYGASKLTSRILADNWAQDLGPKGIRVNTVTPGATTPGMIDKYGQAVIDAVGKRSPLGRIGTAREVAEAVLFLCTESASWITGQQIVLNGAADC